MLFMGAIRVYTENKIKPMNTNVDLKNVKAGGTYSCH
jgi:hypothetical protein